jgi:hypothetical protein
VVVAQVLVRGLAQPGRVQVAVWAWAVAAEPVGIRAQALALVLAVWPIVSGQ